MPKPTAPLVFEQLQTNLSGELWRAAVPGGWLVYLTHSHNADQYLGICPNYLGLGFVPDQNHSWNGDGV